MKNVFELSDKEAKEIYDSPDRCKALLEKKFPFLKGKVEDRLHTIEDIFNEIGITKEEFNKKTLGWPSHKIGAELIEMIAQAFNEGKHHLECIYYPWFNKFKDNSKPSGFGLSCHGYVNSNSYSYVSSRQKFFHSNHAVIAGQRFTHIYEQAFLS